MIKAVFPGSFDPPTNGHLDIIHRASKLFDNLDVLISVNPNKQYMFSEQERLDMLTTLLKDYKNVQIHVWEGLIVNYAKQVGANVLIRGIRSINDFSYEFELAHMNQKLNPEIETMFLPCKEKFGIVKSSSIKDLAMFDGDNSRMVPQLVEKALKRKLEK